MPRLVVAPKRIPHRNYKLAMSAGAAPHYKILDLHGRHIVETAKAAGLGLFDGSLTRCAPALVTRQRTR